MEIMCSYWPGALLALFKARDEGNMSAVDRSRGKTSVSRPRRALPPTYTVATDAFDDC